MTTQYGAVETHRIAVYTEENGRVYRVPFINIEEARKKYPSLEFDESKISELRTRLLDNQLDDNFLGNLSSPLDDDNICRQIMDALFHNRPFANSFRIKEDRSYNINPLSKEVQDKSNFDFLKFLLENYEELKDLYPPLVSPGGKRFYSIKDDNEQLARIISRVDEELNREETSHEYNDDSAFSYLVSMMLDFRQEHIGCHKGTRPTFDYDERLYLNCHNENVLYQFMVEYAKGCIANHIDFNCKGLFNSLEQTADTTILYSQHKDLKTRIKILEDVMNKHPEWREEFDPPVYGGLTAGTGFYSITHKGTTFSTYSNYYKQVLEVVRGSLIAKQLIDLNLLSPSDPDYDTIRKYSELKGLNRIPTLFQITFMDIDKKFLNDLNKGLIEKINIPQVQEGLMKTTPDEFRQRVNKVHASFQHLDPSLEIPLSIDKDMYKYFGYKKEETKKQKVDNEQLKSNVEEITSSLVDYNNDGYVDIDEVIKGLTNRCFTQMMKGDASIKKLAADIRTELLACQQDNRYDIELCAQIDEELTQFEQGQMDSIPRLESIRQRLADNRAQRTGVPKTQDMFKKGAIGLYTSSYENYKNTLSSLAMDGFIEGEPKELEECRILMLATFERTKRVDNNRFDMRKYLLFRNSIKLIENQQETIKNNIRNTANKGQNNSEKPEYPKF